MDNESRRNNRIKIPLDALVQTPGALHYAETRDLSEGGLSLSTRKPFPVGAQLRLVLGQPPCLPKINAEGVVRWLKKGEGVGVEFTELATEHRLAITAFLKSFPEPSAS